MTVPIEPKETLSPNQVDLETVSLRTSSVTLDVTPFVDAVLKRVEHGITQQTFPSATYRVQFNNRCFFSDIEQVVPYLFTLGISDLYCSPFLRARPGSQHGYDIIDHSKINQEIGTIEQLRSLRSVLREHQMGLIADVVPNHMSAMPKQNAWWHDVLENGQSSQFASYFDIDWSPVKSDLTDKISLPLLGGQYGKVLEEGQLVIRFEEGAFSLHYFENILPIAPRMYAIILGEGIASLQEQSAPEDEAVSELLSILTAIRNLPGRTEMEADRLVERRREKEIVKRRLNDLVMRSPAIEAHIQKCLVSVNGSTEDARSFDRLDQLLQEQAYRLCYWRVAADEINYRRFFDINELAAICTEVPEVFEDSHRLIFDLIDEGIVTGLRIDHPDGLYNPRGYFIQIQENHFLRLCRSAFESERETPTSEDATSADQAVWLTVQQRLREIWRSAIDILGSPIAKPLYVVVEKILALEESLPEDWPVHGTVGYESLNAINSLYVSKGGERPLTNLYSRFIEKPLNYEELIYQGKRLIVRISMASELMVLGHRLDRISERNRWTRDFTINSLTRVLQEVIAGFRVYRCYVQPSRVLQRDRDCIQQAVVRAKRRNPAIDGTIFDFVQDMLLLQFPETVKEEDRQAIEKFTGKFQQLTGPIMAKAVEDTTFYRFNRLVSLNEVGGEPGHFGNSVESFHQMNLDRQRRFPYALTASTTHDTKRSEDVRARINVLSEIEKTWRKHVQRWSRWNQKLKVEIDGSLAPSRNAEYLLYQTLVGTWPKSNPTGQALEEYQKRIQAYMLKVGREAKENTSWVRPNGAYEQAVNDFVANALSNASKNAFLNDLKVFANLLAENGYWNSLSQLILKMMSPGVPDFYQGTELWNLTLVDPDNRQPVDFSMHRQMLDGLLDQMAIAMECQNRNTAIELWLDDRHSSSPAAQLQVMNLIDSLMNGRDTGLIKLFITLVGLRTRRRSHKLFTEGQYEPLAVRGSKSEHLVAFIRTYDGDVSIGAAPRFTAILNGFGGKAPIGECWEDTTIVVPEHLAGRRFHDQFTRQPHSPAPDPSTNQHRIEVAKLLKVFPVAMLGSSAQV